MQGLAASIVGLISASAKFIPWLVDISNKIADVPDSVRTMMLELNETSIILKGVQAYISEEEQVAAHRKSLISLENISITLTGFVVTYSDLEKHLDFVKTGDEISSFDRSKWVLREKDILDVVRRLQNHKASLSLMLNIINASLTTKSRPASSTRASQVHPRGQHFWGLALPAPDIATIRGSDIKDGDSTSSTTKSTTRSLSAKFSLPSLPLSTRATRQPQSSSFAFEKDLTTSWVYRRSGFNLSKSSIWSREGSERGVALSTLSQLTWTRVSNISVFSLPIFQTDIYNGYHYDYPNHGYVLSEQPRVTATVTIAMQWWRRKIELTRRQKPIVHQIPNLPNDRLIGRDDILARLETYLSLKTVVQRGSLTVFKETEYEVFPIINSEGEIDCKENTRVFALWGGIGTGKTRLALEYAHKVGGGLPTLQSASENRISSPSSSIHANKIDPPYSYIVWIDAKTKESAKSAILDLAKSLNLELDFQTSGAQLIVDYLSSCGLPWLLIFDDVVDVEAIEGYWPRSSKGSIIITSRDPELCLHLSWKASSDGAMQGQINMKRHPCFPESWFYQESLSFSSFDLTARTQARLIAAIGSSPSLIYAAAEAVNLGLISIVDICGQGYVDFEILAAAENHIQTTKRESTDSITPKLRYREIISQWDDEISRMTAQLTDTSILHLAVCFTSNPLEDEISYWIAARLQPKEVDELVTETNIFGGTQLKETSNRATEMASFVGNKLTSSLRGARRLLGGFPRSSSNFYQFGGTFRRYLAEKITCIEEGGSPDLSSTFISDAVSLNRFRKTDDGPGPTSSTGLVKDQVPRPMYFPEPYHLLVNYFNVPYRLVFIWTSFTRLRQDIGAIIVRGGSDESALDQIAGYLNRSTGIRPVMHKIRDGHFIYGEGASVAFELAAFRTIYGANASRHCGWDAAIVHYSQTGEQLLAICWYALSGCRILGDADSLEFLFADHSIANGKRVVMWPMKRLFVFNTKIARCLHGLGKQKAAVYELEKESASAGTWFDEWKLLMPTVPQEQLEVTSWGCYNSYRCGYAHITLGMIQIEQKELEAAEKSIGSAILCFAQCREIDYMLHYATTANALLGWVRGDLRKHDDAM
ncbi:hypothetical protein TWF173_010950 [Orbilia oligospora]|nr:hypothetical protein TWF173_010950 [Orbilia oligospora]